jgi:hypothetical protein
MGINAIDISIITFGSNIINSTKVQTGHYPNVTTYHTSKDISSLAFLAYSSVKMY